jgi:hypothetical protein
MDTIHSSPVEEILLVDGRGAVRHTVPAWSIEEAKQGGKFVDRFIGIVEKATGATVTFTSHGPNRDDIRYFGGDYAIYEDWYPGPYNK